MVEIAYEALLEAIFDRTFEPGQRIEIRAAAEQLLMSPTPVREALVQLTTQGLTILDSNRGYRVAGLLSIEEFHELFEARRTIEIGALLSTSDLTSTSWILRASEQDISKIRDLERLVGASSHGPHYADFSEFSRADSEFHRAIVSLAGNSFLEAAWHGLYCHLHVSRLYAGNGVIDFEDAKVEHAAITTALENRNLKDLVDSTIAHIRMADTRLATLVT